MHVYTRTHTHKHTHIHFHLCQSEDFLRAYPQFVNFFEMSKEALSRCDRSYPRFHAFLKVSPHCGWACLASFPVFHVGGLGMRLRPDPTRADYSLIADCSLLHAVVTSCDKLHGGQANQEVVNLGNIKSSIVMCIQRYPVAYTIMVWLIAACCGCLVFSSSYIYGIIYKSK